jgi:hypothetical protein
MAITSNETLTVTFCDRAENHIHNQQLGQLAHKGFSYQELQTIHTRLVNEGINAHLINLGQYLPPEYGQFNVGVLVIKNGLQLSCDKEAAWHELRSLTYDKKAVMYGRVCNKKARHNLCFADFDQEPDYENGKGTVVSFARLPELSKLRANLPKLLNDRAIGLLAEANHYYDINNCGIGYHGDKERKIVVGVRYGSAFPLCFYWYHNSKRVSSRIDFELEHGDIYVMDEKACGQDAALRKTPTLRHAAGCADFIK